MNRPDLEKGSYDNYDTFHFLFILTIIQFWWIAIWGIAYIVIDLIAGPSKIVELFIYFLMLLSTIYVVHTNPKILDKL
jgi:hypothetical protein